MSKAKPEFICNLWCWCFGYAYAYADAAWCKENGIGAWRGRIVSRVMLWVCDHLSPLWWWERT